MERLRASIVVVVEVDLDPVPGWGNDPQDFADAIQRHLDDSCPWYHPKARVLHNPGDPTEHATDQILRLVREVLGE